ncbi:MAG: hypothetical protein ACR2PO_19600 [Methyloligellaceae bacterium]
MNGWFGPQLSLFLFGALMAWALVWALLRRHGPEWALSQWADSAAKAAPLFWAVAGVMLFLPTVVAYWAGAYSHGSALSGLLPWSDASLYFSCSEQILMGAETASNCGVRPFYLALWASITRLAGTDLQVALLLQAAVVGAGVVVFAREAGRNLDGPAALAVYAVLFVFAAMFCNGLVMTENAGLLLGVVGMALLLRTADAPQIVPFAVGLFVMAAALNARAGAFLILPALIGWVVFNADGPIRRRIALAFAGAVGAAAGMAVTLLPALFSGEGGASAHHNLAYHVYALAAGGANYLQVKIDHPEIFTQGGSEAEMARRIYEAAVHSILTRPGLFIWGCVRSFAEYATDLFRMLDGFAPLRVLCVALWAVGLVTSALRWRSPRHAMLLWLQAGIWFSSPILTSNGGPRVYAATMAVDALFVGYGLMWLTRRMTLPAAEIPPSQTVLAPRGLLAVGLAAVLMPIAVLAASRAMATPHIYKPPQCEPGLVPVVVRPGGGSLQLPLVDEADAALHPLRVSQALFAGRMHKSVAFQKDLKGVPAGSTLIWGLRLTEADYGKLDMFAWHGDLLVPRQPVGFCILPPDSGAGRFLGQALTIDRSYAAQD